MNAFELLFQKGYPETPLFKTQQELVYLLISNINTKYYVSKEDTVAYGKALNRLKAYLSQLLSKSVKRNVSVDLKNGLALLVKERLKNTDYDVDFVFEEIITSLEEKNSTQLHHHSNPNIVDQLYTDISLARYIAVITSKPIELQGTSTTQSLQTVFFNDLLEEMKKDLPAKHYSFNFPSKDYCFLLWNGLRKLLIQFLRKNNSMSFISDLYRNFLTKTYTYIQFEQTASLSRDLLLQSADEILESLNRNRVVTVFEVSAPIYSMPLIALNPNEAKNCRIYAVLEDEISTSIHRYSQQDTVLWRLFYWNKIRSQDRGIPVYYT